MDGTPITLGDLETILAIEDQIAYLRETYYSGHQWSQEQLDNLNDLVDQINESGLPIRNGGPFSSGIDHTVTASLVCPGTASLDSDYTFQVRLNKAQTKDVTFSYAAWSGSIDASGEGTGTIPAGDVETSVTVHVDGSAGRINGQGAFTVAVWDLKNALFADGNTAASRAVTVEQSYDFVYNWEQPFSITWGYDYSPHCDYMYTIGNNGEPFGNPELENRSGRTRLASTKVELSGLPSGKYDAAIEIVSSEFSRRYGVGPYDGYLGEWVRDVSNADVFFQLDSRDSLHLTHDEIFDNAGDIEGGKAADKKGGYVPVSTSGGTVSTEVSYESTVWKSETWSQILYRYYDYYYYPQISRCEAKLHVRDATAEAVAELSTPAGDFYPGQQVPVTARFSFPMEITDGMSLTVNGQTMHPVEAGSTSDCCTFLYTVKTPMDNAELFYEKASLSGVGANGKNVAVTVSGSNPALGNAKLRTPARELAFTGIRAVIENPSSAAPEMVVSLDISSNGSYTQWQYYICYPPTNRF